MNTIVTFFSGVIALVSGWFGYYYPMNNATNVPANVSQSETVSQGESNAKKETISPGFTLATTTTSGNSITIQISPCSAEYENDLGLCFGSGRYNYTEHDGVWLYDLLSDYDSDRFGGGFTGKHEVYIAEVIHGEYKLTDKERTYYRNEVITLLRANFSGK